MPESRGRKPKKASPQRQKRRDDRPRPLPEIERDEQPTRHRNDPIREIDPEPLPDIPEPASYEQLLVALSELDELSQEVMIASRLKSFPSQRDGGVPVNIPRMVRAPWARQLRKLGIFCIPELATHELVDPDEGPLANLTGAEMRKVTPESLWEIARKQNPALGAEVDRAKTPAQKQALMRKLAASLPAEQRAALEELAKRSHEDLTPT